MQTEPIQETNNLEMATQEVIALCGGDTVAAIKSLLIANNFLEKELVLALAAVSRGYSRGWHSIKRGPHV